MGDTNYFSGTVKILENPVRKLIKNKILLTIVRAEICQIRRKNFIFLVFWGNLGNEIVNSYRTNDYLLVEGYTSIKKKNVGPSRFILTGLKVYPLVLNSNGLSRKKLN